MENDTALRWSSVPGTGIRVGDYMIIDGAMKPPLAVNAAFPGQHPLGARYADVDLENGKSHRCWEGFLYRVGRS